MIRTEREFASDGPQTIIHIWRSGNECDTVELLPEAIERGQAYEIAFCRLADDPNVLRVRIELGKGASVDVTRPSMRMAA